MATYASKAHNFAAMAYVSWTQSLKQVKQTKRKHIMNSKAVYNYKVTVGP